MSTALLVTALVCVLTLVIVVYILTRTQPTPVAPHNKPPPAADPELVRMKAAAQTAAEQLWESVSNIDGLTDVSGHSVTGLMALTAAAGFPAVDPGFATEANKKNVADLGAAITEYRAQLQSALPPSSILLQSTAQVDAVHAVVNDQLSALNSYLPKVTASLSMCIITPGCVARADIDSIRSYISGLSGKAADIQQYQDALAAQAAALAQTGKAVQQYMRLA